MQRVVVPGRAVPVYGRKSDVSYESIIMSMRPGNSAVQRTLAAMALTALAMTAAGCGSSSSSGTAAAHGPAVTIRARNLPGAGTVLVTSRGYALYMFEPDAQREVTCTGLCSATWPPVKIAADARLVAAPGVHADLFGSDPDPSGGRVLTYNGWPLYTYSGDVQPGQDTGQGIDLNGGVWYLMRPSGQPLSQVPQ
jgi:predicted lipoprotein with Yx(FWY)xxD motif